LVFSVKLLVETCRWLVARSFRSNTMRLNDLLLGVIGFLFQILSLLAKFPTLYRSVHCR
jgi:hypothetical protein